MMFISMTSIQFGLLQHVITFGALYDEKKENSTCSKCIKKGSYIIPAQQSEMSVTEIPNENTGGCSLLFQN